MKIALLDDYNQAIHIGTVIVGSVTTTWGHLALRNGWKLIEVYDVLPKEEFFVYLQHGDRQESCPADKG